MHKTPPLTEHDFYDIYNVWYVPFWQRPWFYWTIIGTILLIFGIIAFLLYRRYGKKAQKPISAWQKALLALTALERMPITTPDDGKQFYCALTAILKEYLQSRFGYPLVGKTDSEMASYLKDGDLERRYRLSDICNGCLFIKFANEQAMADQTRKDLERSLLLVKETVPTDKK